MVKYMDYTRATRALIFSSLYPFLEQISANARASTHHPQVPQIFSDLKCMIICERVVVSTSNYFTDRAGYVVSCNGTSPFKTGDRVMGLLSGGGYAECTLVSLLIDCSYFANGAMWSRLCDPNELPHSHPCWHLVYRRCCHTWGIHDCLSSSLLDWCTPTQPKGAHTRWCQVRTSTNAFI
jgi:pterin-4a-carbinolamine dehydratase